MNQKELAEKSGCSQSTISKYLSGKAIPNTTRVQALARALCISEDLLMGFETMPAESVPITKITPRQAAKCMGKSEEFVRIGLQRGLLPFGIAVPGTGQKYNYYINPMRFRDYVGTEQFDRFFSLNH